MDRNVPAQHVLKLTSPAHTVPRRQEENIRFREFIKASAEAALYDLS